MNSRCRTAFLALVGAAHPWRVLLLTLLALAAPCALAQASASQDLLAPLPRIEFAPWKEVAQGEYLVSFPSAIETTYDVNNTVPVRFFVPQEHQAPVPIVVLLHYLGARDIKVERSLAGELNSRGIGAAIVTLPYHLSRTPKGFRSGQLMVEPDPARLVASMTQAVLDVRRTVDLILTRPEFDAKRIGVCGTSMGALVAALVYGVDTRVTYATFVLGGADFARILWSSSYVTGSRELLRRKGFTEDKLRAVLAPVEPLTYLKSRTGANTFVIGGRFDTVIPPASTQELIQALDKPRVLWLETGHYGGVFVEHRLLKEVGKFFELEFAGKEFVPPKRVYAPTLRLGLQLNNVTGFDIGAGLDLWRSNSVGEYFATVLLTPRGPQFFGGRQVSPGLAFGVSAGARHFGLGVLWSTVL